MRLLIMGESVCVRVKCGKRGRSLWYLAEKGKGALKEEMNFFAAISARVN